VSFDEAYVKEAMRRSVGNISVAARMAGLDRSNFRRIVRKFDPPTNGSSPPSEDD